MGYGLCRTCLEKYWNPEKIQDEKVLEDMIQLAEEKGRDWYSRPGQLRYLLSEIRKRKPPVVIYQDPWEALFEPRD